MTYRTTGASHDHLTRTGSASTRGYGTGRVDVLPPGAQPWAEIYRSLVEQRAAAAAEFDKTLDERAAVEAQLQFTQPRHIYAAKIRQLAQISDRAQHWQKVQGALREGMSDCAEATMAECFLAAAKARLSDESFAAIMTDASALVGDKGLRWTLALDPYAPKPECPPDPRTPEERAEDKRRKARRQSARRDQRHLILNPGSHRGERVAEKRANHSPSRHSEGSLHAR